MTSRVIGSFMRGVGPGPHMGLLSPQPMGGAHQAAYGLSHIGQVFAPSGGGAYYGMTPRLQEMIQARGVNMGLRPQGPQRSGAVGPGPRQWRSGGM